MAFLWCIKQTCGSHVDILHLPFDHEQILIITTC